jgi:hypothetical protein
VQGRSRERRGSAVSLDYVLNVVTLRRLGGISLDLDVIAFSRVCRSVSSTRSPCCALGVPARAAVNFSLASRLLLVSAALVAVAGVSGSVFSPSTGRRLVRVVRLPRPAA